MTVQELLAQKREKDKMPGRVIQHVEADPERDSHTGASVQVHFLIIEDAGHGLSYKVWEWARSEEDEYGTGTFACVLDGYGVGRFGSEMNFEGWRVAGQEYEVA